MSGGFKGAFIQGALAFLEESGIRADAYAACSSSVFPAAYAATGRITRLSPGCWHDGLRELQEEGKGMSDVVLRMIGNLTPGVRDELFTPAASRLLVACTLVRTSDAAQETQGTGARSLGRRLLLAAARHDGSWRDAHTELHLFDTTAADPRLRITAENLEAVSYASSRMLHAWDIPAEVDTRPYIDGSYTCLCPVPQLAGLGYDRVIAILTERPPVPVDLFNTSTMPTDLPPAFVHVIAPDLDLSSLGVEFTRASTTGPDMAFAHGREVAAKTFRKSDLLASLAGRR